MQRSTDHSTDSQAIAAPVRRALCALFALALACTLVPVVSPAPDAYADEESDLQAKVEETASAYNDALAEQEQLEDEIAKTSKKIKKLEKKLPDQKDECSQSVLALYKYTGDGRSIIMTILSAESISQALAIMDSYNWIINYNTSKIEKTSAMMKDLEESKAQLEDDQAAAEEATRSAADALDEAKQAREEAAERRAAEQAERKAKAKEQAASGDTEEADAADSEPSVSSVGWSSDKKAFVKKWTRRIDAYLSGSPMAGCGRAYAEAAWDYGVDPRFAPAISNTESSKGRYCFHTYNAWGYGQYDFSSWEDGIQHVVACLADLYGGYLDLSDAYTYCPTGPVEWYNNTAAEMERI
ncbi:MAG: hypothetical protein LUD25_00010 [Coriobacteriaceae bacterium]|nr:hypothetical protein [Coriobacteriaceae bacterium]